MPARALAVAIALIATLLPVTPAGAAVDRLACTGYPEPRVFLESQSWWEPAPVRGGVAHVHVGTCFPYGVTLRGVVTFDVRVVLHNNAGTLRRVKLQTDSFTNEIILAQVYPDVKAPAGQDLTVWYRFRADTRRLKDGLREFAFYAKVDQPNGKLQSAQTLWTARTANGNSDSDAVDFRRIMNQSWYDDAGYAQAGLTEPLSLAVKSGRWRIPIRLDGNSEADPIEHMVTIDPDFHHGHEGRVLRHGSGSFEGNVNVETRDLSNGPHRLVLMSVSDEDGGDGKNTGVQVIPFRVRNLRAYVNAYDDYFSAVTTSIKPGYSVRWKNGGSHTHSTTSAGALKWDVRLAPGSRYWGSFYSSGTFLYKCTIHSGMSGRVSVAMVSTKTASGQRISWASRTAPSGQRYKVQMRRVGGSFSTWRRTGDASSVFAPSRAGTFEFRSQLQRWNGSSWVSSRWSPVLRVTAP
jgi:plastocyanin